MNEPTTDETLDPCLQACKLADQAAAASLYGFHFEAARMWLEASTFATSLPAKKACIKNASREFAYVQCGRTVFGPESRLVH